MKIIPKVPIIELAGKRVQLVKLKDNKFDGNHPNEINEGYTKTGISHFDITIDDCVIITDDNGRYIQTSRVLRIVNENTFQTQNSTYQITML